MVTGPSPAEAQALKEQPGARRSRSLARVGPELGAAFLGREQQRAPGRARAPPRPESASELSYLDVTTGAVGFWFCFFFLILSFIIKGIHAYFR